MSGERIMHHLPDGVYANIPLDRKEIPRPLLDVSQKQRRNPLPWAGQFTPELVEVLIEKYSNSNTRLFDPFLGSGTVFLEAGRKRITAYGTEINPAAVRLARFYEWINLPKNDRERRLSRVQKLVDRLLFMPPNDPHEEVRGLLAQDSLDHWDRLLIEAWSVLAEGSKEIKNWHIAWTKISELALEIPFSEEELIAFNADARKVPLGNGSVNLVITSPPYINVHNYHQQYRESTRILGISDKELLSIAKSEIGSNRKNRGNRFLTVIQYSLDMSMVFDELSRVCMPESRVIIIVGRESTVLGVKFSNSEIIAEVAYEVGLQPLIRQERSFINRYGETIFEDILHFLVPEQNTTDRKSILVNARRIAVKILEGAYSSAGSSVKEQIRKALDRAEDIEPSPIFTPTDKNTLTTDRLISYGDR